MNDIIQLPEKLKVIMDNDQRLYVKFLNIIDPFTDILRANDLFFFPEYTDHGIKHIENTLKYAENLIAEDTFSKLTAKEVGVMLLSIVLHDIGMHTNAEMFKNMIEGKYDNLANLFPNGKTWKELWEAYIYDSQYWGEEKKNNVFGDPTHNISFPNLSDLQSLTGYDKNFIGEFIRIHHCRIAHEVAINGYIGKNTIRFGRDDDDSEHFIKMAGIVARSHGMNVRDTFEYLEELFGDTSYTPFGIHVVYLMVLLRLADYLQIDNSRTNDTKLSINVLYSPYSLQEHKTHLSIKDVLFDNKDKEKIVIHANPKDAQTYVKIEWLAEEIQKEFDRSWAILGEVYTDYKYKLRYRRISTNISNEKYKSKLDYVPEQFCFRYNNDLFKLLIAPLYGDDPSYGVRELVQNAVDACRLCMDDLPSNNKPHVKVEVNSKKMLFTITDMGKGMNLYEIKNYFLTIGSSYNDNIDWKKTRDQEHIYRTGRFGIGVLAAFLLGPEINVETRKRNEKMGYRFTASLHDKNIQIEKVPDAEYGTKIEIKCSEKCIEYFGESYNDEWYKWYIGKKPIVAYYYNGKRQKPEFDLSEYKKLNHSSEKYGNVFWKPQRLISYNTRSLYCNGFLINNYPQKKEFSSINFDGFRHMNIPSLQIDDIYNQLPLNLKRDNIEESVKYDFEESMAREVFIDLMCQLMATDLNSIFDSGHLNEFYFHNKGFSLQSDYIYNCVKETGIIRIPRNRDRSYYRGRMSLVKDEMVKILENSKYCMKFDETDRYDEDRFNERLSDVIERFGYDMGIGRYEYDIDRRRYEYGEDRRRYGYEEDRRRFEYLKQRQIEILYGYFKGCFAVLDDNTRQQQLLKQHFSREVILSFNGWLLFAPNSEIKELFEKIILLWGDSISTILIKNKEKSRVPKTFIDDLFKKYMGKDPVVPYEFEERQTKFPLLFQDYSKIIEQYRNKKD